MTQRIFTVPHALRHCLARLRTAAAILLPIPLSACLAYPVAKLIQPEAKATVLDAKGLPLWKAKVALVARAFPAFGVQRLDVRFTDRGGIASFPAVREWQTETLMIHGYREYYWNWCIRADGYETYISHYSGPDDFVTHPTVRLLPGKSLACDAASG